MEVGKSPLLGEGGHQTPIIGGCFTEPGHGDIYVIEPDHRVDVDVDHLGTLPHYLSVHLALGRNVDDDVTEDPGRAAETMMFAERSPAPIGQLGRTGLGQPRLIEWDGLGRSELDLASPTDPSPAANRVEIDSEMSGGIENRGAGFDLTLPAGRSEQDPGFALGHL
jgi:hypothetical protein